MYGQNSFFLAWKSCPSKFATSFTLLYYFLHKPNLECFTIYIAVCYTRDNNIPIFPKSVLKSRLHKIIHKSQLIASSDFFFSLKLFCLHNRVNSNIVVQEITTHTVSLHQTITHNQYPPSSLLLPPLSLPPSLHQC